jgi:uncharacterized protein YbcI
MDKQPETMARAIADAVIAFEQQRTGRAPESVSVMLGEGTLVVTLHGALSQAERALAQTTDGAARVEEFQRQLFQTAGESLRQDIQRIVGSPIRVATTETDRGTGSVVHAFPGGTMIQVYLFAGTMPVQHWSGSDLTSSQRQDATN